MHDKLFGFRSGLIANAGAHARLDEHAQSVRMGPMTVIRQYDETNFVTSLRALAAAMVVVIHTGAFTAFGYVGNNITQAGKYGVEIFFVISGFSIAVTFTKAANYQTFIVRRAFRIVPLYVFVIFAVFMLTRLGALRQSHWLLEFDSHLDA